MKVHTFEFPTPFFRPGIRIIRCGGCSQWRGVGIYAGTRYRAVMLRECPYTRRFGGHPS